MKEITDKIKIKKLVKVNQPLNTLTEDKVLGIIKSSGALHEGHFQLLSGLHSNLFLKFRRIVEKSNNGYINQIGNELVSKFKDIKIDVVLGSMMAGSLLVDKMIEEMLNSRPAYVEADSEGRPSLILRRGYSINPKDHVLIINDLSTTGEGLNRLIKVIKDKEGIVSGIGLFATRNRSVLEQKFKKETEKIEVLIDLNVEDVPPGPKTCSLCKKNIPLEYSKNHA